MNQTLLSEDQRDALQEMMNISMGQAARSLAQLIDTQITLSIPTISEASPSDLAEIFSFGKVTWYARQSFLGQIKGEVLSLIGKNGCEALAELMDYDMPLTEVQTQELILELTNILSGACLSGLSSQLELKTNLNMPTLFNPSASEKSVYSWSTALLVEVTFSIESFSFNARVMICMEENSILTLKKSLDVLVG
ncbi:MAG: chemotaxis protein CheC [Paraglaciecola sp.]|uniref:chemotaxis protein CheC n=1 Tax=Pseudomonadati TaxID=3379134 RepID=UPI00273D9AA8|nr:chemotaxis protein CheC [Paraglaciecola sp.]MDP5033237.1 chemotaxis protein CheC [Paraglaciecola sp.]MDP5129590.1 chemotaxis protein CheC [Paraglaciecola sp.]